MQIMLQIVVIIFQRSVTDDRLVTKVCKNIGMSIENLVIGDLEANEAPVDDVPVRRGVETGASVGAECMVVEEMFVDETEDDESDNGSEIMVDYDLKLEKGNGESEETIDEDVIALNVSYDPEAPEQNDVLGEFTEGWSED